MLLPCVVVPRVFLQYTEPEMYVVYSYAERRGLAGACALRLVCTCAGSGAYAEWLVGLGAVERFVAVGSGAGAVPPIRGCD